MKLKPMLKYELKQSLGLLLGFYAFSSFFLVILTPFLALFSGQFSFSWLLSWIVNFIPTLFRAFARTTPAMDVEMVAFLFILGFISFAPVFRLSQNENISRKTMYASHLIHVAIISGVAAFLNGLSSFLSSFDFTSNYPYFLRIFNIYYRTNIFGTDFDKTNKAVSALLRSPQFITGYFLWTFCIGAMMLMFGYLMGLCFYKLTRNNRKRLTISAPVLVLPLLSYALILSFGYADSYLVGGVVTFSIFYPTNFMQSTFRNSPYFSMLCYLLLFAAFAAISWLLIRRATISAPTPATAAEQPN